MTNAKKILRPYLSPFLATMRQLRGASAQLRARYRPADLSIFHDFAPPPSGGGHQFLRALWGDFARRGLRVENNTISPTTRACLFNSFNFDADRLRRIRHAQHSECRMVHRVDGPIGVYRGHDDGTDRRIWQLNQALADATILQSHYSLHKHVELGLPMRNPVVILNTPDPALFHRNGRIAFEPQRKIRLISTSWSDNPNKGAAVYQWLDEHLDWARYDYTFVGRSPIPFTHIRMMPPLPSTQLADQLRQHDIFITASRDDPCSNALLEALACGLPAIYLRSGGHPELVGEAGLGFETVDEILPQLTQLVDDYATYQALISVPSLHEIATQYLAVLGVMA